MTAADQMPPASYHGPYTNQCRCPYGWRNNLGFYCARQDGKCRGQLLQVAAEIDAPAADIPLDPMRPFKRDELEAIFGPDLPASAAFNMFMTLPANIAVGTARAQLREMMAKAAAPPTLASLRPFRAEQTLPQIMEDPPQWAVTGGDGTNKRGLFIDCYGNEALAHELAAWLNDVDPEWPNIAVAGKLGQLLFRLQMVAVRLAGRVDVENVAIGAPFAREILSAVRGASDAILGRLEAAYAPLPTRFCYQHQGTGKLYAFEEACEFKGPGGDWLNGVAYRSLDTGDLYVTDWARWDAHFQDGIYNGDDDAMLARLNGRRAHPDNRPHTGAPHA